MPAVDAQVCLRPRPGPDSAVTWLSTPQLGPDLVRMGPTDAGKRDRQYGHGRHRRRQSSGRAMAAPKRPPGVPVVAVRVEGGHLEGGQDDPGPSQGVEQRRDGRGPGQATLSDS